MDDVAEILVECDVENPPALKGYYKRVHYKVLRKDGELFVAISALPKRGKPQGVVLHWPIIEMIVTDTELVEKVSEV